MQRRLLIRPLCLGDGPDRVRCAHDSVCPGYHVEWIVIVLHLPVVVDEQGGNAVTVHKALDDLHFPVVLGVGRFTGQGPPPYFLQRVNDDQLCVRVLHQVVIQGIKQAAVQLWGLRGEIEPLWSGPAGQNLVHAVLQAV